MAFGLYETKEEKKGLSLASLETFRLMKIQSKNFDIQTAPNQGYKANLNSLANK